MTTFPRARFVSTWAWPAAVSASGTTRSMMGFSCPRSTKPRSTSRSFVFDFTTTSRDFLKGSQRVRRSSNTLRTDGTVET